MRVFCAVGRAVGVSLLGARASADEVVPRPRRFEVGVSSGYSHLGLRHTASARCGRSRSRSTWTIGSPSAGAWACTAKSGSSTAPRPTRGKRTRPSRGITSAWRGGGFIIRRRSAQCRRGSLWGSATTRCARRIDRKVRDQRSATRGRCRSEARASSSATCSSASTSRSCPRSRLGPFLGASVVAYGEYRGIQDSADCSVWSSIGLKAALRL